MIDFITALWFGFLGACVGSFLNVVAYRMPLRLSVVWQPSHCPLCKKPIRPYDNVPILGWLWLRGRCRDCRAPIAPRYALVETIVGALFFLLAYVELFSGGANLPRGPLTEMTGAWHNVWQPHWPLLGVYAVHATLMALLTTLVLFELDGHRAPRLFVVVGATLIALGMLLCPDAWRVVDGSKIAAGDAGRFQYVALLGAIPGALLAVATSRSPRSSAPTAPPPLYNGGVALALAGAVTGWRIALAMAAVAAAVLIVAKLARKDRLRIAGGLPALVWLAMLAVLVAWRPLATMVNWPS